MHTKQFWKQSILSPDVRNGIRPFIKADNERKKEMKDAEKLDLQDLDLVSGGFKFEQLTPEEQDFYLKLRTRVTKALNDYAKGRISQEELMEIQSDMDTFRDILGETYRRY